jgi:hypothetical protein
MNQKECTKCKVIKPISDYNKDKSKSDGLYSSCRICYAIYKKSYYDRNKKNVIKKVAEWGNKNIEKVRVNKLKYSKSEKGRQVMRTYSKLNKNKYYPKTPEQKLKALWRKKMSKVKNRVSFSFKTFDFLGYNASDLKKRLEMNFKPGMSWDNHGEWHIDHKKPLSYFDYSNTNEVRNSWLLCNLQPLWAKENLTKNNLYIG